MSKEDMFDGFMPYINNITISESQKSLASNAEIVDVHSLKIITADGKEYYFSISPENLSKLNILILKVLLAEV